MIYLIYNFAILFIGIYRARFSPECKILRHKDAGVFYSGTFLFPEGRRSKMKASGKIGNSFWVRGSKSKMPSISFNPFLLFSAMILLLAGSLSACGGGERRRRNLRRSRFDGNVFNFRDSHGGTHRNRQCGDGIM